jgi:hypothetical protein
MVLLYVDSLSVIKLGPMESLCAGTTLPGAPTGAPFLLPRSLRHYEAILLATNYICDHPPNREEGLATKIQSTDANVARDCLKLDTHNHHNHIENLAASFSNILDAQLFLQINLGWLLATKGSAPLCRLKAITAETACQAPTLPPPPPTKSQLRNTAHQEAISEWQNSWM